MFYPFFFYRKPSRAVLLAASCLSVSALQAQEKQNVLFIVVDDLRPELGCYGSDVAITPHLDKLAEQSVVFQKAYCNVPVSGASRSSLLTGVYPDIVEGRFVDAETRSEKIFPAWSLCRWRLRMPGIIRFPLARCSIISMIGQTVGANRLGL